MTALQIDTDASRHAARTWAQWADQINAAGMLLGGDVESLDLPHAATACSRMTAAATELWTVSGFLTLLVEQLQTLDGGAPLLHASAIDELMWLARGSRGSVSACAIIGTTPRMAMRDKRLPARQTAAPDKPAHRKRPARPPRRRVNCSST